MKFAKFFHHFLQCVHIFRATILVLILESRWTEYPRRNFIIENNSTCYLKQEYEIIRDCHPCTGTYIISFDSVRQFTILFTKIIDFEIASKSQGVCVHTHNKEVLRCKNGETVSRR